MAKRLSSSTRLLPTAWSSWSAGRAEKDPSDRALLAALPEKVRNEGLWQVLHGNPDDHPSTSPRFIATRLDRVTRWLDAGLDPDTVVRRVGNQARSWASLLGWAVQQGDGELATLLLRRGASIHEICVPPAQMHGGEERFHDPVPLVGTVVDSWPSSRALLHILVRSGADFWVGGKDPHFGTRCPAVSLLLAGGVEAAAVFQGARPDTDWNRVASNGEQAFRVLASAFWSVARARVHSLQETERADHENAIRWRAVLIWLASHGASARGVVTDDGTPIVHAGVLLGDAELAVAVARAGADWRERTPAGETVEQRVERMRSSRSTPVSPADCAAQDRALQAARAAASARELGDGLASTVRKQPSRL